jgi:hypothetical protein
MTIKPGAFRFNTDSMKLEIFRGSADYEGTASMAGIGTLAAGQWEEIQATSPEVQTGGTRALFAGGTQPGNSAVNRIDYINIDSTGDAIDFGDLAIAGARTQKGALASRTRGVFEGGTDISPGNVTSTIEFTTIASTGDTVNFGTANVSTRAQGNQCSNSTRGMFAAGYPGSSGTDRIDYITIASEGNSLDFGNLTAGRYAAMGCGSSTRAIWMGGADPNTIIDYVTISTLGNAADFGDLTSQGNDGAACSNSVRGLCAGADSASPYSNVIEYITLASNGNSQDFGDMAVSRSGHRGAASATRGVFGGGNTGSITNTIDCVQIMSIGNAVDFGDLTLARSQISACSNGHGGL